MDSFCLTFVLICLEGDVLRRNPYSDEVTEMGETGISPYIVSNKERDKTSESTMMKVNVAAGAADTLGRQTGCSGLGMHDG